MVPGRSRDIGNTRAPARHRRRRALLEPAVGGPFGSFVKATGALVLVGALGGTAYGIWGGSEAPAPPSPDVAPTRTIPPIADVVEATTTRPAPAERRLSVFRHPWTGGTSSR